MSAIIVIPSRFNSSRFPGKPLVNILGRTLLNRVWSIAKRVSNVQDVYIATDDERIEQHAFSFGANVIMTPSSCDNGTLRVYAATKSLKLSPDDIVVNLQGDAVLTPPWVIESIVDAMKNDPSVVLATLATKITSDEYFDMNAAKNDGRVGGTMVVFNKNHDALYFSKSMIPFLRNTNVQNLPIYRHIGLYGYCYHVLETYVNLPATPLEQLEGLEQLRLLENCIPIRVVEADYRGRTHCGIDNPYDVETAESIISKDGELI